MTCEVKRLGATAISGNVSVSGDVNAKPVGLTSGGLVTEVVIDDSQWYALPSSPLPNRNSISIQNQSDNSSHKCKLNYSTLATFSGAIVYPQGERFYGITDGIIIYAKAFAGQSFTLTIEELA